MEGKAIKFLIVTIIVLIFTFLIYWAGISAPKKKVAVEIEYIEYESSLEISPLYKVYYEWNGVRQPDPWWMILKKDGVWRVIELRDLVKAQNKGITDFQKFSTKFDFKWVRKYKFKPQPTRYETILLLLGAQSIYSEEKNAFMEIIKKEESF